MSDPESTATLLSMIQQGDAQALDRLLERCLPPLRRWAHGRLPRDARDLHDTGDLVQDTVVAAFKSLPRFEARFDGALQAYLRHCLANRIRDVIRYRRRRPAAADLPADVPAEVVSPLDEAIGHENLARFDAALARLRPEEREAIVGRLELQYGYAELAAALDKPSADAARVAVKRALRRLAEEMRSG